MFIKFWGVRGSLPHSPDPLSWVRQFEKIMNDFFLRGFQNADQVQKYIRSRPVSEIGGYGTATTCVEVTDESGRALIVDGGSGIKAKSDVIQKENQFQKEYHILLTHYHFDHILGLPFFSPHFMSGCKINYYSVQNETEEIVRGLFKKPTFPISYHSLNADIAFHKLIPYQENQINGFSVIPFKTDHPDTCYGFKISDGQRTYSHAVDNEAVRRTKSELGRDAGLYENTDLLFFDAQYDESEMNEKKGWGHGTGFRGLEICANFNIKQILLAHHDPGFSIEDSIAQEKKTEAVLNSKFSDLNLKCAYAYDGLEIKL